MPRVRVEPPDARAQRKPHEPLQAQQQEHLHTNQLFNNRLLAAKSAAADPIQAVPSELIIDI
jgi:hypothetical protein